MFDLYSQPPPAKQKQHTPYEFSKLRTALASSGSTDSFVPLDSPEAPKPMEETLGQSQAMQRRLGKYHEFVRGTSDGTFFKVVRRKEFQPAHAESLPTINLPLFQAKAREEPKPKSNPVKSKETSAHGYMENKRYWDKMNRMLSVKTDIAKKPVRIVYRKSRSVEIFPGTEGNSTDIQPMFRPTRGRGKGKDQVLYRSRTKAIFGTPLDCTLDSRTKIQKQRYLSTVINQNRTEDGVQLEELKMNIRERVVALIRDTRPIPTKGRKFV